MTPKLLLALGSAVLMLVACSSDDASDKKDDDDDDTSTSSSSSGGGGGGSSSSGGGSSSGSAATCAADGEACTDDADCRPVDFWQCSDSTTAKYSPNDSNPRSQCVSGRCFDWSAECDATCVNFEATCRGVTYRTCD